MISTYSHLNLEIDDNEVNQNITNIQLDDMFFNCLQELKAD